jgi:hypothetical protein
VQWQRVAVLCVQGERKRVVVRVLWYEFPAKGFGKDGLRQLVNVVFGFLVAGFNLVSICEKLFNAADDLLLLPEWRKQYLKISYLNKV